MSTTEVGNLSVKVGLDSTEFNQGIKTLSQRMQIMGQECKNASLGLDKVKDAAEISRLNITRLTGQIGEQRKIVDQMREAHAKAAKQYGETSKQAQAYELKLLKSEGTLKSMERSLATTTARFKEQTSALNKLSTTLTSTGTHMTEFGDKMQNAGESLSMRVTAPILAAGAASAKLASDMDESLNKVDVAFKDNAQEVKTWSESTLEKFGLAQGSSLDSAALYGDMGTAMGQTTAEASKMSTSLVGLGADLSSFKNIKMDQASDALKGIYTGEGEALKTLGIIMQDSTLKSYAKAQGMKKDYSEMEQAEKVALRYAFVMDATKNAQGDFARTSGGAANQSRLFAETLKEVGAGFGEEILPVVTPLLTELNKVIKSFGELDDGTKKVILGIAGLAAVAGPTTWALGGMLKGIGNITKGAGLLVKLLGPAAAVTAEVGGAATVATGAVGAGGIAGLGASLGGAAIAAGPWLLAGAAVVGTGYAINKAMSQEAVPAVDLFADSVTQTTDKILDANGKLVDSEESKNIKISEGTKKAIDAYLELDKQAEWSLNSFYVTNTKVTKENADSIVSNYAKMGEQIKTGMDKRNQEQLTKTQEFFAKSTALSEAEEAEAIAKMKTANESKKTEIDGYLKRINEIWLKASQEKRGITLDEEKELSEINGKMKTDAVTALSEQELESKVILERMKSYGSRITTEQASEAVKNANRQRDESISAANQQYDGVVKNIINMRDVTKNITADQAQKMLDDATKQRDDSIARAGELRDGVVGKLKEAHKGIFDQINENGDIRSAWTNLIEWFDNNPVTRWIKTGFEDAGQGGVGAVPGFATGTSNWRGGLAQVNEKGGEIMSLPGGTQIIPHDISLAIAKAMGKAQTAPVYSVTVNNPIPEKASDSVRKQLMRVAYLGGEA